MADVSKVKVGNTSYNIKDTEGRKEENLIWGGPSKIGSLSPVGMSLSSEHSANRLAFINKNALKFEYSSDAGSTWTEYTDYYIGTATADWKTAFCTTSQAVPVGRQTASTEITTDSRTRFTITAQTGTATYVYTNPKKVLLYVSTATPIIVDVETRTGTNMLNDGAWSLFDTYNLQGWSGWNDLPIMLGTLGGSSSQKSNNWQLRFTFRPSSVSSSYPTTCSLLGIRLFGDNAWSIFNDMARNNHLYAYDYLKNATFPANLKLNGDKQVGYLTATPASGQVVVTDGASGGMKTTGYTIAKSVPSDAVFTDTQSDWNVTDTSSKAYIKNKPTTLGTVTTVKVGSTSYSPTSGVVSLPAYPSVPITAIQQDGTPLTPSSGTVNIQVGLNKDEYGPNASQRILARGNVFVPVFTTNPEANAVPNWGYNGLVCVKIGTPTDILRDIPTGVTWSNFAYLRMMNMSVLSATVSWTEAAHSTSLIIGYIYDNHISPSSNYAYTDYPMKAVTTLVQRDNGSGANRDTARIIISDTDGSIRVAPNGSTATAFANYHRVQFSISYVNQQAYGPNDERWYNEAP